MWGFKSDRLLALGLACSLDQIPSTLDVARCGLRLTDTQAQREFSVQHSVSEIDVARSIEPLENLAIDLVAAAMTEADQVQRRRGCQFEIRRLRHPARELLGKVYMLTKERETHRLGRQYPCGSQAMPSQDRVA